LAITLLDMLLNARLINRDQFDEALRNRVLYGGRIGTSLIELGYVSEETLARFLSDKLAVPYVPPQKLLEIPEEVIAMFPRELAIKYRAIPLRVEKKRLDLVMADPADLQAIDEIGFITGFIIQPHVTPEVRLAQAFGRYYQEEMDPRYLHIFEIIEGQRQVAEVRRRKEEARRREEEERRRREEVRRREEEERRRQEEELRRREEARRLEEEERHRREEEQRQREDERRREEEERRSQIHELAEADILEPDEPPIKPHETAPVADWPEHIRKLQPDAISLALAYADSGEDIVDNLIAGLGKRVNRVALFRVRGDRVVGWKGIERHRPLTAFAQLSLPLTEPSVLKTVTESAGYYLGTLKDTPINHVLHDAFGGGAAQTVLLMPLLVGGRIVSILYVEDGNDLGSMVPELQKLLAKAALAFEMLICRDKILML
jgi:type II secretion system (T2SS) protein E